MFPSNTRSAPSSSIPSSGSTAGAVGSNSAMGSNSRSAGFNSSRIDGVLGLAARTWPKSAVVVSRPSSMPPVFPPPTPGASSMRLVVSISSDSSGSGWTSSISRSSAGAGGGAKGGAGSGGAGAAAAAGALAPFGWRGSSRSRKTRLDVLRFPDLLTSSPPSGRGGGLGGAVVGGVARPPAAAARLPGSVPYIFRCSDSISRRFALSGEMSVNSFSAAKAWSIFPTFCMRSAYSTKFCLASAMNPLAA